MSGGSKNYICYKIEAELCGQMHDDEINDLMEDIKKLAHDLEWWISSDISKERYFETVKEFKKKWFESTRDERLKDYVDRKTKELRDDLYILIGLKNREM
ncbi:MAG: hypothetical protein IKH78_08280 [Ruminococcus sp.]|nr:hypothetical protein [Ruminococcus sp.]